MCKICGAYEGHELGCPHYKSDLPVCAECGSYVNGEHYKLGDSYYHADCINNLTALDVLNILNIEVQNGN